MLDFFVILGTSGIIAFRPVSNIRYTLAYVYSEDSNQSVHPHSLSLKFYARRNVGPLVTQRAPIKDSDQTA